jgi:hypothetical protein
MDRITEESTSEKTFRNLLKLFLWLVLIAVSTSSIFCLAIKYALYLAVVLWKDLLAIFFFSDEQPHSNNPVIIKMYVNKYLFKT